MWTCSHKIKGKGEKDKKLKKRDKLVCIREVEKITERDGEKIRER